MEEKKTTIYLVRHGESLANNNMIFAGHYNIELSDTGFRQANAVCDYLKNFGIDVIYSSDLNRARTTAKPLSLALNKKVTTDVRLREIYGGDWEAMPFVDLPVKYPKEHNLWLNDLGDFVAPNGESIVELFDRSKEVITEIANKNLGKVIAIFTHGTVIRVFGAYCMGKTKDEYGDVDWASNASTTEIIYNKGEFELIEYGRNYYMEGFITNLPRDF